MGCGCLSKEQVKVKAQKVEKTLNEASDALMEKLDSEQAQQGRNRALRDRGMAEELALAFLDEKGPEGPEIFAPCPVCEQLTLSCGGRLRSVPMRMKCSDCDTLLPFGFGAFVPACVTYETFRPEGAAPYTTAKTDGTPVPCSACGTFGVDPTKVAVCEVCAQRHLELRCGEPERPVQGQGDSHGAGVSRCANGHRLTRQMPAAWCCEHCRLQGTGQEVCHGCRSCSFDLCGECNEKNKKSRQDSKLDSVSHSLGVHLPGASYTSVVLYGSVLKCAKGHRLAWGSTGAPWQCVKCKQHHIQAENTFAFSCWACEAHQCKECTFPDNAGPPRPQGLLTPGVPPNAVFCPDGHMLRRDRVRTGFECNGCGKACAPMSHSHGCLECTYDLCTKCYVQRKKGGLSQPPSVAVSPAPTPQGLTTPPAGGGSDLPPVPTPFVPPPPMPAITSPLTDPVLPAPPQDPQGPALAQEVPQSPPQETPQDPPQEPPQEQPEPSPSQPSPDPQPSVQPSEPEPQPAVQPTPAPSDPPRPPTPPPPPPPPPPQPPVESSDTESDDEPTVTPTGVMCPQGHELMTQAAYFDWVCDSCLAPGQGNNSQTHGCRRCDYDLCAKCLEDHRNPPPPPPPVPTEPTAIHPAAPAPSGRCLAVFIGINYYNSQAELSGCVNDVRTMMKVVDALGFKTKKGCNGDRRVLVDNKRFPARTGHPTKREILDAFKWLAKAARPGDTLFVHYSGHGSRQKDLDGDEDDGYDETLVPVDYQSAGCITDDVVFDILCRDLPAGVRMTVVCDCCHSGSLLDLPYEWRWDGEHFSADSGGGGGGGATAKSRAVVFDDDDEEVACEDRAFHPTSQANKTSAADIVMLSGCGDTQTSSDVSNVGLFQHTFKGPGAAGGACTNGFVEALRAKKVTGSKAGPNGATITTHMSYGAMLQDVQVGLKKRRFKQIPVLSCSKHMEMERVFSLFGPLSN